MLLIHQRSRLLRLHQLTMGRICWGIAPEPRFNELVHLAAMERLSKLPTDDLLTTKMPSEFELIAPRNLRVIVFPTETSQLSFDSAPVNDDDSNKENASSTRYRIYSSGDQPCLRTAPTVVLGTSGRCPPCTRAFDRLRKYCSRRHAVLLLSRSSTSQDSSSGSNNSSSNCALPEEHMLPHPTLIQ